MENMFSLNGGGPPGGPEPGGMAGGCGLGGVDHAAAAEQLWNGDPGLQPAGEHLNLAVDLSEQEMAALLADVEQWAHNASFGGVLEPQAQVFPSGPPPPSQPTHFVYPEVHIPLVSTAPAHPGASQALLNAPTNVSQPTVVDLDSVAAPSETHAHDATVFQQAQKRQRSGTQGDSDALAAPPKKGRKPASSGKNPATSPQKPASSTRKPASSPQKPALNGKENTPGKKATNSKETTARDLADSDVEQDDYEAVPKKGRKWTVEARTALYEYLLGSDADAVFKELQVNAVHVFKKAVRVLKMTYSDEAARKHWGRALSTFHLVLNVVNTTGGAGDVDIDTVDESEILDHFQNRLEATRSQGRNAGNLSASTLELWHNQGWTDLFKSRYAKDARVDRPEERNSATQVVDAGANETSPTKKLSETVTEQKHMGKPKNTVSSLGEGLQEVLLKKVINDEERLKARQRESEEKLVLERERLQLERERENNRVRLEFVKVVDSEVLEKDTKDKINAWAQALFP